MYTQIALLLKLSIIIPVYNTESYLERSIQSIINQTLTDIEIICVDDGSTDNSGEILKKYENIDTRIKVIELYKNYGPGYARNIGIESASGEFIGFMDSDDYVDQRFFENLFKYSKNNDIVKGIFVDSTNKSSNYIHRKYRKHTGYIIDSIFRQSFLDQFNIRFPNNIRIAEDVKFRKDCYIHNPKLFEVPDEGIYYYYKQREGSTWRKSKLHIKILAKKAKKASNNRKRIVKKNKKFINKI